MEIFKCKYFQFVLQRSIWVNVPGFLPHLCTLCHCLTFTVQHTHAHIHSHLPHSNSFKTVSCWTSWFSAQYLWPTGNPLVVQQFTIKLQNFSNSVTAALNCHLVANKKTTKCIILIRGWSVNKRVNKLITINELFKHRLLSSESVLTTETCVETELHMRGVYRMGKNPSEEQFKLKDCGLFKNHKVCSLHLQLEHRRALLA